MGANAIGLGSAAATAPPSREVLRAVGVDGRPEFGRMELVREGVGSKYYAKDARGTLYALEASFSDAAAVKEIRDTLAGRGYQHAFGLGGGAASRGALSAPRPSAEAIDHRVGAIRSQARHDQNQYQSQVHPNQGSEHVSALKNALASHISDGIGATDLRRAMNEARQVLANPTSLGAESRRYLQDFYRQGQTKLQAADAQAQSKAQAQAQARRQAAAAGDATVRHLGEAIAAFDRGAGRDTLNAALAQARSADKSGWTAAQRKGFEAYERQASARLYPTRNLNLTPGESALAARAKLEARMQRGQQAAKAPPRVADAKTPVGAQGPNGQGLQGDLVRINERQWGLKGSTSLYRVPEHIQDKAAAIAYAKKQIEAGGWGQLRALDPRTLGGSDRGKQTAQYLAPLRQSIDLASAEITANEQHWAELSNTKNLLQRSLDNGTFFDINFTPAAVIRLWDLAHGRKESRFALADGFARYDQARGQLNSIFSQAASGRITRDAAQAQVNSVMAKYSAGHTKQTDDFAQRAETGALPVTAAKVGSPTVAALLVGKKAKGSPVGAALAGGVSYAMRTTQDYGAWWMYNKSPWAGSYDPDIKAYAPKPTAQSNTRNLILAAGDAAMSVTFGKAPQAISAGKLSFGGKAIVSNPRVLANTFGLSGVTALPTSLLGTAVDQQFDQAALAKQVQQTEADVAKWKQTSLDQQKQTFEAERPRWLRQQAVLFENQKQTSLQQWRTELAAQKQVAMSQARTQLAGMPAAQRQAALDNYSQRLDRRIEQTMVQKGAELEAQRAPARQRAEASYARQQSDKTAKLGKLLDAKGEVTTFQAQAALEQARLNAPLQLADQALRQAVSIPVNYGAGLAAGFLPPARGGAPVTRWTEPLHVEALPAFAEIGHGAFTGVADAAVQGLVVDGQLPDRKTLVQAAVNEAFELPFETGAARDGLNAARQGPRGALDRSKATTATLPRTPTASLTPLADLTASGRLGDAPKIPGEVQDAPKQPVASATQPPVIPGGLKLNTLDRARQGVRNIALVPTVAGMSLRQNVVAPTRAFLQQRVFEPLALKVRLANVLLDTSLPGQLYNDTIGRALSPIDWRQAVLGASNPRHLAKFAMRAGGGAAAGIAGLTGLVQGLAQVPVVMIRPVKESGTQALERFLTDPEFRERHFWDPARNATGEIHLFTPSEGRAPIYFTRVPYEIWQKLAGEERINQSDAWQKPGSIYRTVRLPDKQEVLAEIRPPHAHPSQWVTTKFENTTDPANPFNTTKNTRWIFGPFEGLHTAVTVGATAGKVDRPPETIGEIVLAPGQPASVSVRQDKNWFSTIGSVALTPLSLKRDQIVNVSKPPRAGHFQITNVDLFGVGGYSTTGVRERAIAELRHGKGVRFEGKSFNENGLMFRPFALRGTHADSTPWVLSTYSGPELAFYPADTRLKAGGGNWLRATFNKLNAGGPEWVSGIYTRGIVPGLLPVGRLRDTTLANNAPIAISQPPWWPLNQPYLPPQQKSGPRSIDSDSGDPRAGGAVIEPKPGIDPDDRDPPTTPNAAPRIGPDSPPYNPFADLPYLDPRPWRAEDRGYTWDGENHHISRDPFDERPSDASATQANNEAPPGAQKTAAPGIEQLSAIYPKVPWARISAEDRQMIWDWTRNRQLFGSSALPHTLLDRAQQQASQSIASNLQRVADGLGSSVEALLAQLDEVGGTGSKITPTHARALQRLIAASEDSSPLLPLLGAGWKIDAAQGISTRQATLDGPAKRIVLNDQVWNKPEELKRQIDEAVPVAAAQQAQGELLHAVPQLEWDLLEPHQLRDVSAWRAGGFTADLAGDGVVAAAQALRLGDAQRLANAMQRAPLAGIDAAQWQRLGLPAHLARQFEKLTPQRAVVVRELLSDPAAVLRDATVLDGVSQKRFTPAEVLQQVLQVTGLYGRRNEGSTAWAQTAGDTRWRAVQLLDALHAGAAPDLKRSINTAIGELQRAVLTMGGGPKGSLSPRDARSAERWGEFLEQELGGQLPKGWQAVVGLKDSQAAVFLGALLLADPFAAAADPLSAYVEHTGRAQSTAMQHMIQTSKALGAPARMPTAERAQLIVRELALRGRGPSSEALRKALGSTALSEPAQTDPALMVARPQADAGRGTTRFGPELAPKEFRHQLAQHVQGTAAASAGAVMLMEQLHAKGWTVAFEPASSLKKPGVEVNRDERTVIVRGFDRVTDPQPLVGILANVVGTEDGGMPRPLEQLHSSFPGIEWERVPWRLREQLLLWSASNTFGADLYDHMAQQAPAQARASPGEVDALAQSVARDATEAAKSLGLEDDVALRRAMQNARAQASTAPWQLQQSTATATATAGAYSQFVQWLRALGMEAKHPVTRLAAKLANAGWEFVYDPLGREPLFGAPVWTDGDRHEIRFNPSMAMMDSPWLAQVLQGSLDMSDAAPPREVLRTLYPALNVDSLHASENALLLSWMLKPALFGADAQDFAARLARPFAEADVFARVNPQAPLDNETVAFFGPMMTRIASRLGFDSVTALRGAMDHIAIAVPGTRRSSQTALAVILATREHLDAALPLLRDGWLFDVDPNTAPGQPMIDPASQRIVFSADPQRVARFVVPTLTAAAGQHHQRLLREWAPHLEWDRLTPPQAAAVKAWSERGQPADIEDAELAGAARALGFADAPALGAAMLDRSVGAAPTAAQWRELGVKAGFAESLSQLTPRRAQWVRHVLSAPLQAMADPRTLDHAADRRLDLVSELQRIAALIGIDPLPDRSASHPMSNATPQQRAVARFLGRLRNVADDTLAARLDAAIDDIGRLSSHEPQSSEQAPVQEQSPRPATLPTDAWLRFLATDVEAQNGLPAHWPEALRRPQGNTAALLRAVVEEPSAALADPVQLLMQRTGLDADRAAEVTHDLLQSLGAVGLPRAEWGPSLLRLIGYAGQGPVSSRLRQEVVLWERNAAWRQPAVESPTAESESTTPPDENAPSAAAGDRTSVVVDTPPPRRAPVALLQPQVDAPFNAQTKLTPALKEIREHASAIAAAIDRHNAKADTAPIELTPADVFWLALQRRDAQFETRTTDDGERAVFVAAKTPRRNLVETVWSLVHGDTPTRDIPEFVPLSIAATKKFDAAVFDNQPHANTRTRRVMEFIENAVREKPAPPDNPLAQAAHAVLGRLLDSGGLDAETAREAMRSLGLDHEEGDATANLPWSQATTRGNRTERWTLPTENISGYPTTRQVWLERQAEQQRQADLVVKALGAVSPNDAAAATPGHFLFTVGVRALREGHADAAQQQFDQALASGRKPDAQALREALLPELDASDGFTRAVSDAFIDELRGSIDFALALREQGGWRGPPLTLQQATAAAQAYSRAEAALTVPPGDDETPRQLLLALPHAKDNRLAGFATLAKLGRQLPQSVVVWTTSPHLAAGAALQEAQAMLPGWHVVDTPEDLAKSVADKKRAAPVIAVLSDDALSKRHGFIADLVQRLGQRGVGAPFLYVPDQAQRMTADSARAVGLRPLVERADMTLPLSDTPVSRDVKGLDDLGRWLGLIDTPRERGASTDPRLVYSRMAQHMITGSARRPAPEPQFLPVEFSPGQWQFRNEVAGSSDLGSHERIHMLTQLGIQEKLPFIRERVIERLEQQGKAVIFSRYVDDGVHLIAKDLKRVLPQRGDQILAIDGSTSSAERQEALRRFALPPHAKGALNVLVMLDDTVKGDTAVDLENPAPGGYESIAADPPRTPAALRAMTSLFDLDRLPRQVEVQVSVPYMKAPDSGELTRDQKDIVALNERELRAAGALGARQGEDTHTATELQLGRLSLSERFPGWGTDTVEDVAAVERYLINSDRMPASQQSRAYVENRVRMLATAMRHRGLSPRLLDLGSGQNRLVSQVMIEGSGPGPTAKIDSGVGIDQVPVALLQKQVDQGLLDASAVQSHVQGLMQNAPTLLPGQKFNIVTANLSLIADDPKTMASYFRAANRMLEPHGRFLLTRPLSEFSPQRLDLLYEGLDRMGFKVVQDRRLVTQGGDMRYLELERVGDVQPISDETAALFQFRGVVQNSAPPAQKGAKAAVVATDPSFSDPLPGHAEDRGYRWDGENHHISRDPFDTPQPRADDQPQNTPEPTLDSSKLMRDTEPAREDVAVLGHAAHDSSDPKAQRATPANADTAALMTRIASASEATRTFERGYRARFEPMRPDQILRALQEAGHGAEGIVQIAVPGQPPVFALLRNHQRTISLQRAGAAAQVQLSAALDQVQWASAAGLDPKTWLESRISFLRTDNKQFVGLTLTPLQQAVADDNNVSMSLNQRAPRLPRSAQDWHAAFNHAPHLRISKQAAGPARIELDREAMAPRPRAELEALESELGVATVQSLLDGFFFGHGGSEDGLLGIGAAWREHRGNQPLTGDTLATLMGAIGNLADSVLIHDFEHAAIGYGTSAVQEKLGLELGAAASYIEKVTDAALANKANPLEADSLFAQLVRTRTKFLFEVGAKKNLGALGQVSSVFSREFQSGDGGGSDEFAHSQASKFAALMRQKGLLAHLDQGELAQVNTALFAEPPATSLKSLFLSHWPQYSKFIDAAGPSLQAIQNVIDRASNRALPDSRAAKLDLFSRELALQMLLVQKGFRFDDVDITSLADPLAHWPRARDWYDLNSIDFAGDFTATYQEVRAAVDRVLGGTPEASVEDSSNPPRSVGAKAKREAPSVYDWLPLAKNQSVSDAALRAGGSVLSPELRQRIGDNPRLLGAKTRRPPRDPEGADGKREGVVSAEATAPIASARPPRSAQEWHSAFNGARHFVIRDRQGETSIALDLAAMAEHPKTALLALQRELGPDTVQALVDGFFFGHNGSADGLLGVAAAWSARKGMQPLTGDTLAALIGAIGNLNEAVALHDLEHLAIGYGTTPVEEALGANLGAAGFYDSTQTDAIPQGPLHEDKGFAALVRSRTAELLRLGVDRPLRNSRPVALVFQIFLLNHLSTNTERSAQSFADELRQHGLLAHLQPDELAKVNGLIFGGVEGESNSIETMLSELPDSGAEAFGYAMEHAPPILSRIEAEIQEASNRTLPRSREEMLDLFSRELALQTLLVRHGFRFSQVDINAVFTPEAQWASARDAHGLGSIDFAREFPAIYREVRTAVDRVLDDTTVSGIEDASAEPIVPPLTDSVGAAVVRKAPSVYDWLPPSQNKPPSATTDVNTARRWWAKAPVESEPSQTIVLPTGLRADWARRVTEGVTTITQARDVNFRELAAYYRSGVNPALANRRAFVDGLLRDTADAVEFIEIPGVLKPINDHVGHLAADKLLAQVLDTAADVARQHPGVTVYQLDALRLAVEGSERETGAFADAFEARIKQLKLSYVANGVRYANKAPGDAADPLVREGLPVVRARLDPAQAGSRKELLAQGIDALDRASESLKRPEAEGGKGELDPERGAHLLKLKTASASADGEPLWVKDPGMDPTRQPKDDERRATQQLSTAMLEALQAQTDRVIGHDPAQLPAAKRAIEELVLKAFSTDEAFGHHLGNELAFNRAERERRSSRGFDTVRTVHGFIDVGAVGVTNRDLSRFTGDVVLTTVHATAAAVARDINQRQGLTGGEAIEVFAVGGDELRFFSSKTKYVRLFAEEFAEAMQQATIDGVAGDTPGAAKRVALSAIPVYVGIGNTKQEAEAMSNAAKANASKGNDPQRVPGQLPPGYLVEKLGQSTDSTQPVWEAPPQTLATAIRGMDEPTLRALRDQGPLTVSNIASTLKTELARLQGLARQASPGRVQARQLQDPLTNIGTALDRLGQADPHTRMTTFMATLPEALREHWQRQLSGGPTLESLLIEAARSGVPLTRMNVQSLVRRNEPVVRPTRVNWDEDAGAFDWDSAYELRYEGLPELQKLLQRALVQQPVEDMQLSTPDGEHRFDVYRIDGGGYTMIDAHTDIAIQVASHKDVVDHVVRALGVELFTAGALVVSYGSLASMSEPPSLYWTVDQVQAWLDTPPDQRAPVTAQMVDAIDRLVDTQQVKVAPGAWSADRHRPVIDPMRLFQRVHDEQMHMAHALRRIEPDLWAAWQALMRSQRAVDTLASESDVSNSVTMMLRNSAGRLATRIREAADRAVELAGSHAASLSKPDAMLDARGTLVHRQALVRIAHGLRTVGHPDAARIGQLAAESNNATRAQAARLRQQGVATRANEAANRSNTDATSTQDLEAARARVAQARATAAALLADQNAADDQRVQAVALLTDASRQFVAQARAALEALRADPNVSAADVDRAEAWLTVANQNLLDVRLENGQRAGTDTWLMAGFGSDSAANKPILDALDATDMVEGGQLKNGVMEKLLALRSELATELGVPQGEVPMLTASLAAAAGRSTTDALASSQWQPYYQASLAKPMRPELLRGMDALRSSAGARRRALDLGSGAGTATAAMLDSASGFDVLAVDANPLAQQYMQPLLERHGNARLQFAPQSISEAALPAADLVWAGLSLPYLGPQGFAQSWPRITHAIQPGGVFAGDFFGPKHWMNQLPDESSYAFHDRAQVQKLFAGFDVLELNETDDQIRNDEGLSRTHVFSVVARKHGGEAPAPTAGSTNGALALPKGWGLHSVIDIAGDGIFELTNERGDAQVEMEVVGLQQEGDGVARIVSMSAQDARLLARAEETMAQMKVTQVVVPRVRPQAEAFFTAAGYRPDAQSQSDQWVKDIGTKRTAADVVADAQQSQRDADSALRARRDLQMIAGGEPSADESLRAALQGTDLVADDGTLHPEAAQRLVPALAKVAKVLGLSKNPHAVPPLAAAHQYAKDYWTAQSGTALTVDAVQTAVTRQEPIVRPPQLAPGNMTSIEVDSAHELNYSSGEQMKALLGAALKVLPGEAMQIRTPDGERRFDVYRHPGRGTTMIDQSTDSAVRLTQRKSVFRYAVDMLTGESDLDAVVREVTDSLRIGPQDHGSLVVSYGSSDAVMSEQPQFYLTRDQLEQILAQPPEKPHSMTAHTARTIDGLVSRGEIEAAPGVWDPVQNMPLAPQKTLAQRALNDYLQTYPLLGRSGRPDPLMAALLADMLSLLLPKLAPQDPSRQAQTIFMQFARARLARLPDLYDVRESHARLVALADALEAASHPDAQRVRAIAVVAQERLRAEEAARMPSEQQGNDAAEATIAELKRLLESGEPAQLDAADRLVAEVKAAAAALRADPSAGADAQKRADDLETVAHEMLRQSRADRALPAGDAQLMLSPRDEPASNDEQPLQPLVGKSLIERGQLTAELVLRITRARRELADEVGQQPQDISLDIAALKLGQDYWTARIGGKAKAFDLASRYQEQLEQKMAPLRRQAAVRKAAQDELAQLRGDLGHDRQAASPGGAQRAVQDFLAQVEPRVRQRWEWQLVGGPTTLDALLLTQAQAQRPLTQAKVQELVWQHEPVIKPHPLPRITGLSVEPDAAYAIRFDNRESLKSQLELAFDQPTNEMMQIRTADHSHWLEVYRHVGQGMTIIDQSTGTAFDGGVNSKSAVAVVLDTMGVEADDRGDWVVSFGTSDAVRSEKARFYWTRQQIDEWLALPPDQQQPVTRAVERALSAAALQADGVGSMAWNVDDPANLDAALSMLHRLGLDSNRIDDDSARDLLILLRDQARHEHEQWVGRENPPRRLMSLADYMANLQVLSHNLPLTQLVDSSQTARWKQQLIGGPSLHEVLWQEVQAERPLSTANIDHAVSRQAPVIRPPLITDPLADLTSPDRTVELRFDNREELEFQLAAALSGRWSSRQPMRIRTTDNSRMFDFDMAMSGTGEFARLIPHVPGQAWHEAWEFWRGSVSSLADVLQEAGLPLHDGGALTFSYGRHASLGADTRFYWTTQQVDEWMALPPIQRPRVTEQVKQAIDAWRTQRRPEQERIVVEETARRSGAP